MTDIREAEGGRAADSIGATFVKLDVRDEAEWIAVVEETLSRFGKVNVLVNNAGVFLLADMLAATVDHYREVIEINQVRPFPGVKAVASPMIAQKAGSISTFVDRWTAWRA